MTSTPNPARRLMLLTGLVLAFFAFTGLGTWQLIRLQWKLDLIDRVNQRVHAPPSPIPAPSEWPTVTAATDEYRHVRLSGTWMLAQSVRVQALTELGNGYWLITPLRLADGTVVLVNRGFVEPAYTMPTATSAQSADVAVQTITGLLRISEPGGGFLRRNDPAGQRWYSRDVQAIATAQRLIPANRVAPFFVDRDGSDNRPGSYPVGGLTVVSFHNSHLVYALTWYALALMVAGMTTWLIRDEHKHTLH